MARTAGTVARYADLAQPLAAEARRRAEDRPPVLGARFVVARGILRDRLSGFTGTPAKKLKFEYGNAGKPSLVDHDINFNISHSAELGLFAFAPDCSVNRPLWALVLALSFWVCDRSWNSSSCIFPPWRWTRS